MEFKKDDSCSIQKSSFKVSLVFFYLSLTRGIDYKNEDFLFILYYYSTATILFFPILLAKYIASSALEIRVNKSIVNSKA